MKKNLRTLFENKELNCRNLNKISRVLQNDNEISQVAKWLKYDLEKHSHILEFIETCNDVENWGYNEFKPESSFLDTAYESGEVWRIKSFYYDNNSINADLVDDFFYENRELILEELNSPKSIFKGDFGIDDIIFLSENRFLEHCAYKVLELEINAKTSKKIA